MRTLKKTSWLNRNVAGMTIASLLSDACHEMVLAVLPGFLPIIGVAAAALGWIEGLSDAFSSFLKLAAGWYSDRIGQRKWMVVLGYFFTGTGLSLFTIAKSWPVILLGRMVSWFGKGLRVSLRDAMLSESVSPDDRGKAFGFHRAGDTVGAILGPLAGVTLLGWLPHNPPDAPFRTIFLFSLIPGIASSVAFAVLVHETRRRAKQELKLWGAMRGLSARYFRFLTGVGLFGMGDFSPSLLIMAASLLLAPRYGPVRAAQLAAMFYVVRNAVYAAGAFPMGALGDRLNKRRLLAAGYVTAALAAFGMAGLFMEGFRSLLGCGLIFTLSGLFAAAQDTLEGAIPPDLTPAETRGTAYGMLGAVNGVGDLIASAMVGTVWTLVSPSAAFFTAGTLMLAGAIVMAIAPRR